MIFEVAPLKQIPRPCQAQFGHTPDFLVWNHVIPDIDICHFTNETLMFLKASSQFVLILSKYKVSTSADQSACNKEQEYVSIPSLVVLLNQFVEK